MKNLRNKKPISKKSKTVQPPVVDYELQTQYKNHRENRKCYPNFRMNKFPTNLFLSILIALLGQSCKKEENQTSTCAFIEEVPPRYMFAPDSVKSDSTITIIVYYNNPKHCQHFDSFSSVSVDSTVNIALQTKIDTCNCTDDFDLQIPVFQYKAASTPGHSIISMHVIDTLYYRDTIVVY